ncbi:MAG TPA: carbohydrate binding domain-containing protein [Humisphaera sp.]|jgi:hypothetical protein|nr:carbohydrate binding domain-containing protein [Humisphaera sp.]
MTRLISLALFALLGALALAPTLGAADDQPADTSLTRKTDDVKNWRLEQHEQAKGAIAAVDGAIVFDVTKEDGTDWHVQAFQSPIAVKENQEYTITFKAKADAERPIKVQAGIDVDDWHLIGLDEDITLTKEWKDYQYTFTANNVSKEKNRVGIMLGMATGKVYVKDLAMKPKK